jgi:hypothetical protein
MQGEYPLMAFDLPGEESQSRMKVVCLGFWDVRFVMASLTFKLAVRWDVGGTASRSSWQRPLSPKFLSPKFPYSKKRSVFAKCSV